MKIKYVLIVLLTTIFITFIQKVGFCSWPYYAYVSYGPIEQREPPNYYPYAKAAVRLGKIMDACWYRDHHFCLPPIPQFAVMIDWESPTQPDCYYTVFAGWATPGFSGVVLGSGEILPQYLYDFRSWDCWYGGLGKVFVVSI